MIFFFTSSVFVCYFNKNSMRKLIQKYRYLWSTCRVSKLSWAAAPLNYHHTLLRARSSPITFIKLHKMVAIANTCRSIFLFTALFRSIPRDASYIHTSPTKSSSSTRHLKKKRGIWFSFSMTFFAFSYAFPNSSKSVQKERS